MNADGSSRAKGSMWEKLPSALHRVGDKEEGSSMRTWPGVACACPGALYGAGSCRLPTCYSDQGVKPREQPFIWSGVDRGSEALLHRTGH